MSTRAISASRGLPVRVPVRLLGDERLAALAAAGDASAFDALYRRHQPVLYRYCRSMVRHEQDAQDVLQSTMTRAFAALGDKSPNAPLRAWLFRIAHNESVNLLRRRRHHADTTAAEGMPAISHEPALEARERLRTLVDDLQHLPERQRTALVMRELSGSSHREIGQALEMSESSAKQAILDARLSLAEFEKGREMRCADVQSLISERDGRKLRGRPVRAHLRTCGDCRRLRDAIGQRQADLAALAPPLPVAAAAALLAKILGGGSGGAGGGLVAAGGAQVASGALLAKVLATGAVLATAGVATERVVRNEPEPARSAPPAAESRPAMAPATADPAADAAVVRPVAAGEGAAKPRRKMAANRPGKGRRRGRGHGRAHPGIGVGTGPAAGDDNDNAKGHAKGGIQRPSEASQRGKAHIKAKGKKARPERPARPTRPAPKPKRAKPRPTPPQRQPKPRPTPKPKPKPEPTPTAPTPAPTGAPEPAATEPADERSMD